MVLTKKAFHAVTVTLNTTEGNFIDQNLDLCEVLHRMQKSD